MPPPFKGFSTNNIFWQNVELCLYGYFILKALLIKKPNIISHLQFSYLLLRFSKVSSPSSQSLQTLVAFSCSIKKVNLENFCLFILKSVALKTFTVNSAMKWIANKIMNARKVWERLSPTSNNEKWIYDHVSKQTEIWIKRHDGS